MYSILILIALIIGWLIYQNHIRKRDQRLYESIVSEIFDNVSISNPRLDTGTSYGYTSFTLTFKNEEDCKSAEENGLTKHFSDRIRQFHSYIKSFDADRAVFFTWEDRTFPLGRIFKCDLIFIGICNARITISRPPLRQSHRSNF